MAAPSLWRRSVAPLNRRKTKMTRTIVIFILVFLCNQWLSGQGGAGHSRGEEWFALFKWAWLLYRPSQAGQSCALCIFPTSLLRNMQSLPFPTWAPIHGTQTNHNATLKRCDWLRETWEPSASCCWPGQEEGRGRRRGDCWTFQVSGLFILHSRPVSSPAPPPESGSSRYCLKQWISCIQP